MASRAFSATLSSASSNWLASTSAAGSVSGNSERSSTPCPKARSSSSFIPLTSCGTSTASGFSSCRRENASSRCVSAAPRWAPCTAFCSRRLTARFFGQPFLEQAQAAEDRHQQIVEVMSDAAGQLPDGVHLLRFEQLRQRRLPLACPILDPQLQLLIEALQLPGAFGDALLELRVEAFELAGLAEQVQNT